MTDTAKYADIVLPSTTQLEHFDVRGVWGHHYISANLPAIAPLGEAKSHGAMMRLLAPRPGLDGAAFRESDEEIAAAALPEGVTLEAVTCAEAARIGIDSIEHGITGCVNQLTGPDVPRLRDPQALPLDFILPALPPAPASTCPS